MFTGIVTDIGEVIAVEPRAAELSRLTIACDYDLDGINIGASVACAGVCLTVAARGKDRDRTWFAADAAAETLRVTTARRWRFSVLIIPHTLAVTTLHGLAMGEQVNLEVDLIARYAARLLEPG